VTPCGIERDDLVMEEGGTKLGVKRGGGRRDQTVQQQ